MTKRFLSSSGINLFDDRIKIDVRGEMYAADGVETPGELLWNNDAGIKNIAAMMNRLK